MIMLLVSAFPQEANQTELDSPGKKRRHPTGFVRVIAASAWPRVDVLSHLLYRRRCHIRQCRLRRRHWLARVEERRYATPLPRHPREFLQRFYRTGTSAHHCLMFVHAVSGHVVWSRHDYFFEMHLVYKVVKKNKLAYCALNSVHWN